MRIHYINKGYISKQIIIGDFELQKPDIDKKTVSKIELMQDVFKKYLGEQNEKLETVSFDEMLKKLAEKMESDLHTLDLKSLKKIQNTCLIYDQYSDFNYPNEVYKNDHITISSLADLTLNIYKNADKDFYLMAKKIIENRNTLFYLNNSGVNNNFDCEFLKKRVISCFNEGDNTYPSFIHELQHSIDRNTYQRSPYYYHELAPIFFELLMCDYFREEKERPGMYGDRIDSNKHTMKYIIDYVDLLEKYCENGCVLNNSNFDKILGVNNLEELEKVYQRYINPDLFVDIQYLFSFLRSIQIRKYYYISKKMGISKLKQSLQDKECKINLKEVSKDYESFMYEMKYLSLKK